ncbi:MAG: histone deacetylase [Planctomycetota bacterium]
MQHAVNHRAGDASVPCLVYSWRYNIGFYGFERLHPFDSRKYGRAWRKLKPYRAWASHRIPDRPARHDELARVHRVDYLARLHRPACVAAALELPFVKFLPAWLIDLHILRPLRWATRGTILAAEAALQCGLAINLSGGYHHAKPHAGEGFCLYADAAIAIESLRASQQIDAASRVMHIDTDAHQGNGVCHCFMDDSRVFLFDIFHADIYPQADSDARARIDCAVPIHSTCTDDEYLGALQQRLPGFIDSITNQPVALAIYNAGTDVFRGDPLGGLHLSADAILARDLFVVEQLRKRGIPTVMLLSGGYTRESHQLVATSIAQLLQTYGSAGA